MTTDKPACVGISRRHNWAAGRPNDHNGALWLRQHCTYCHLVRMSGGVSYCGRPNGRTFYTEAR